MSDRDDVWDEQKQPRFAMSRDAKAELEAMGIATGESSLSGPSTGIQVRLCRSDLLVEIEATAIIPNGED